MLRRILPNTYAHILRQRIALHIQRARAIDFVTRFPLATTRGRANTAQLHGQFQSTGGTIYVWLTNPSLMHTDPLFSVAALSDGCGGPDKRNPRKRLPRQNPSQHRWPYHPSAVRLAIADACLRKSPLIQPTRKPWPFMGSPCLCDQKTKTSISRYALPASPGHSLGD